ncbi:hypothetical protein C1646_765512 [Rhizophagus diaphanus]|nr:hypothetical protein C1646_765512 [Rhizophagus diaphanus] [Rhizophagus sp. MUCL 43196]
MLYHLSISLHKLGYCHKDLHTRKFLQINRVTSCLSDYGLSEPAIEQKSDDKNTESEFGKGTPEFYKKLAYKYMNINSNEKLTTDELYDIFSFWYSSIRGAKDKVSDKGKEIKEAFKEAFKEADKEIPNTLTSYEKNLNFQVT